MQKEMIYGTWRTDKPKEDGWSQELISSDTKFLLEKGSSLDTLEGNPFEGVDTIKKALYRNVEKNPNADYLGTRVGDEYQWATFRDVASLAEHLSYGIVALDLVPTI